MANYAPDKSNTIVPFAPTPKAQPEANIVADDSGRTIIALLQKASEMAKDDCARAMDLAHKLSFQLRSAEERAREVRAKGHRAKAALWHHGDQALHAALVQLHHQLEVTARARGVPGCDAGATRLRGLHPAGAARREERGRGDAVAGGRDVRGDVAVPPARAGGRAERGGG